jgi:hypothetical protein
MKSGFAFCLALGFVALGDASLSAQPRRPGADGGRFGWLGSLSEGKAEARKTGKPLMVVIRCVP